MAILFRVMLQPLFLSVSLAVRNLLAVGIIGNTYCNLREQQKWDLDDYIKEIDEIFHTPER
ncbi:MAG: hypothetical protein U5K72_03590 [Balneolaceae bacterium]|nr:hypothetical protein [Balneolaceae bacterium]